MSEPASYVTPQGSAGLPDPLRIEREQLISRRSRYNQASFALGIPALILMLGAPLWFADSPTLARILAWLGAGLFCGAGAFYALYLGRHPAWGLLSLASLFLMNLLPDLNDRRLAELNERLGDASAYPSKARNPLWYAYGLPILIPLAPIGLIYGLVAVRRAQQERRSLVAPLLATVWAGIVCCILVSLIFSSKETGEPRDTVVAAQGRVQNRIAQGRLTKTVLLPGWESAPEIKVNAAIDLGIADLSRDLYLTTIVVPKQDVSIASLPDYAKASVAETQRLLTKVLDVAGPENRMSLEQTMLEYRIDGTVDGPTVIAYLITFRETKHCFLQVTAWTTPSRMGRHLAELREAAAGIQIIEE